MKRRNEEVREKHRDTRSSKNSGYALPMLGKSRSEKAKRQMSAAKKEKHLSTKRKMSIAQRRYWKDQAFHSEFF